MYLAHYNLREKPFNISPDSRFLWLSEKHKEALATLKYGVMENKGFLVLTGEVGTGKTMLINALIKITEINALTATIPDPDLEIMDFFNLLAEEFKMNKVFSSKGDFLIQFEKFLLETYASDKTVLLVIDEAQRLNYELLEQIRLLSNIELDNRKLINIFFIGQSEFNQILGDNRCRAVRQRIAVNFKLEPLSQQETIAYIAHRLKLAGATEEIFKPDAAREVFSFSHGYPRLINVICDLALLTGFSSGSKKINAAVVKECGKELQIPKDVANPLEKPSAPHEMQPPPNSAAGRPMQNKSIIYGAAFIILLFITFIGYHIYGSSRERVHHWDVEDYAPRKEDRLLTDRSQALMAEIGKAKEAAKSDVNTTDVSSPENEQAGNDAAETLKKEETGEGESRQDEMPARQPADFTADQNSIIYFEHNSNDIPQKAYETLDNIVKFTVHRPNLSITVTGFTDSKGDREYNEQLSKYRADIVKNYLIGQGVSPANIKAIGKGPQNPVGNNKTLEGRQMNRRVVISVHYP
jgi:general secretion pathway protein A